MKGTTEKIDNQEGGFLGNFLTPLVKVGLPLKKNVLMPLIRNVLIQLGLTAVVLATDGAIKNKIHGSKTTVLIISWRIGFINKRC